MTLALSWFVPDPPIALSWLEPVETLANQQGVEPAQAIASIPTIIPAPLAAYDPGDIRVTFRNGLV